MRTQPRLKILIDAISLLSPITGIGRYAYEITRELAGSDKTHDYLYYYGYVSRRLIRPSESGTKKAKNLVAKNPWLKKAVRNILAISTRLLTPKMDIYWQPNFIPSPGIRARKTIVSVHDFSFLHHPTWQPKERIKYLTAHLLEQTIKADRIITGSEHTKHEIAEILGYDAAKVDVIYHGVRHDIFRPLDKIKAITGHDLPKRYILAVGSMEPRKNFIGLLRAYNMLPGHTKKRYKLVIVGPKGWNNAEIIKMIERERDNVIYLGYLSDHDLALAYNLASAFVYPSFYEGFGIPPLEAMACGTPVIASNASSIPEVCRDAALYIDPQDSEELADRIEVLLNDDELQQTLRSRGFERAKAFSWQRSATQHLAVFNNAGKDL